MAEISEKSFPFDSDQDKMGNYDREYYADDFAEYFRAFISSGVFMDDESSLRVDANGDMTVTLNPGRLIGEGYRYTNKSNITITIDPADGVLDRIDRIAIVWSKSARDMHYEYHVGEPSYDPVAPECRRTEEYMDYVLADIHVTAGIISITQNDIEDQRLNPQVCGLATPFMQLDTNLIFHQLQGFYEKVLAEHTDWEAAKKSEVEAWFNTMKGQLTADAAVNLQNQIFELAAKSFTLTNNLLATEAGKSALDAAVGPVIQGQIDEINSNLKEIKVIIGTCSDVLGYGTEVDYPNGFNQNNTIVISMMHASFGDWYTDSAVFTNDNYLKSGIRINLTSTKIQIISLSNESLGTPFKVLLMKV